MRSKKAILRSQADKLWYQVLLISKCEVCGKQSTQVHHFFPKGMYGFLRYDLDNGISMCNGCHFAHHHKGDPTIHQTVINKRGRKWYEQLLEKSKEQPTSYMTIGWYKENIERLEGIL